jgi:hypothetical protein
MALFCEAFYEEAKQSTPLRNAEQALKGLFSGFGKERSARSRVRKSSHFMSFHSINQEIIPELIEIIFIFHSINQI